MGLEAVLPSPQNALYVMLCLCPVRFLERSFSVRAERIIVVLCAYKCFVVDNLSVTVFGKYNCTLHIVIVMFYVKQNVIAFSNW